MGMVTHTARLVRASRNAWDKRWAFLIAFITVFFLSLSFLLWIDLVPNPTTEGTLTTDTPAPGLVTKNTQALSPNVIDAFAIGEMPLKIEIPSIGVSASIANPNTTNVATLDQYLLKGAVRYPGSGLLGANGNVILFAHSSYLPIVHNLAYKTFDGIQNLKKGDRITVSSSKNAYVYVVDTVVQADANSDGIPLTTDGKKLTLATCDSFGQKTDRFVVTATLVESHPLGS
jgi:LPXTG-site transpeptidase (sortase) family protein